MKDNDKSQIKIQPLKTLILTLLIVKQLTMA
jgi:hypothetical protein